MLTVVITAHNESAHIQECVRSALFLTQNVVVCDLESTDNTANLARNAGAQVHTMERVPYVELIRMASIKISTGDWVLILDPDERIPQELVQEIASILPQTTHSYFKIPRKNIFGKETWLKHGGWWPDYQTRLIKKSALVDWPARIHATPIINGTVGHLTSPLVHYFHGNITQMVNKTMVFENIESDLLHEAKRPVNTATFFRKFAGELTRRIILKWGVLDGMMGLLENIYQAYSKTITYLYLYEKTHIRK